MKLPIPRETLHRDLYLFSLALLVCSLPLSRFLLSLSQILLALNWLAEGNIRRKIRHMLQHPSTLAFASVFLLYAAGMFFSENKAVALEKVKNVLPLLLMPVVMGTSLPLSAKTMKHLLGLFSLAVVITSLICMTLYLVNGIPANGDFRSISVFMPHLRFALHIDMAIFVMLYLLFRNPYPDRILRNISLLAGVVFLVAFLFFLRSATGIIIFVLLTLAFSLRMAFFSSLKTVRYGIVFVVAAIILSIPTVLVHTYNRNFSAEPVLVDALEPFTANGNPYIHNRTSPTLENGHYTNLYVCNTELAKEWNEISKLPFDGADLKGNELAQTLRRYLTSKGLRKDSAAMRTLTSADVNNIEKGLANYRFRENPGIYQRLYETLWEIHMFRITGYVHHHSFGQRLAFLKIALVLIRENLWTGTGSGDVYDSMRNKASSAKLTIDPLWEGKPHNQFLFFALAFGIPGLLWVAFCWIYPIVISHAYRNLLFNLFAGIVLISMITLDTMESYDSIVFFSFFYALFVFGSPEEKKG